MWIMKIFLVVLALQVLTVLAVPRRHKTTKNPLETFASNVGTSSHGSSGSHGLDTGLGSGINLAAIGGHKPTKPTNNPNGNTDADRNNDCKLIFNIGLTADGKPTVTSIKMPQLTRMLNTEGTGTTRDSMCNLIFAVNPTININKEITDENVVIPGYLPTAPPTVNKPTIPTTKPTKPVIIGINDELQRSGHSLDLDKDKKSKDDDFKYVFEQQLAVWPTDIETVIDTLQPQPQQHIYYPEWSTSGSINIQQPVYEDQIVVFPEILFDDYDEDYVHNNGHNPWGTTVSTPTVKPEENDIEVVESFNVVHLNGTSEHKLVLSNGMVNYKKIYKKLVDGKVITVQEGYDSVPIPGTHNTQFNTQFYIADEHGHNVYRVEQNVQQPELPHFLSFRDQVADAKKTGKL